MAIARARQWVDEQADAVEVRSDTRARGDEVTPWGGRLWQSHDFGELVAPRRAEVWWDLPEGRFVYFRCTVTELRWA